MGSGTEENTVANTIQVCRWLTCGCGWRFRRRSVLRFGGGCDLPPKFTSFLITVFAVASVEDLVIRTSSLGRDPDHARVIFVAQDGVRDISIECAAAGVRGHKRTPAQTHDQSEDVIELTCVGTVSMSIRFGSISLLSHLSSFRCQFGEAFRKTGETDSCKAASSFPTKLYRKMTSALSYRRAPAYINLSWNKNHSRNHA